MKCKTLKENVKIDWAVGVSEMKCYRAKKQALEEIEGSQASQYGRLWEFCGELRDKNPGSSAGCRLNCILM